MKKRVFVGGLHHESDTFNPIITKEDDIFVKRGTTLLDSLGDDAASGIIKTLRDKNYDVVPSLVARAVPNGEWDYGCYMKLKKELLDCLKTAGKLDAVCLALHGSMRVKGLGAAEGDLLEDIHRIVPDVPVFASLDMHATVTARMMKYAAAFVGYKCAPHTDTFETGVHAAKMAIDYLENGAKPVMRAVHVPFIVAGEQSETSVEPMKSLTGELRKLEKKDGIMACSYLLGFPWADTEENGVTALVVTDGNRQLADTVSMELAQRFWSIREKFGFYNETHDPETCLEKTKESLNAQVYPVVISDSGDNPTAGSSQDVTNFLSLLLRDPVLCHLDPPLVYQGFYDKPLVEAAKKAGTGNTVTGLLGAKYDTEKSSPIPITAKVKAVVEKWGKANFSDLVLLDIGGIDVVVTSGHVGCYDPEMMRALGMQPETRKVIVVKLGYLEPEIRAIAKRSMMALTTGSSDELFSRLPYKKMKRPVYPLDGDFEPDLYYVE